MYNLHMVGKFACACLLHLYTTYKKIKKTLVFSQSHKLFDFLVKKIDHTAFKC